MVRKVYALLVGLNEYLGGVPHLHGCINDVKSMLAILEEQAKRGAYQLIPLCLTAGDVENPGEEKPTRQSIINGFRNHLMQAGEGDVALFYYSGHGAQEKAPPAFWHIEPDHLDETLVCYDSRTEHGWDLADKELAVLIAEVAQNNPHILVVLDACHSGSGTRAPLGVGVRLAPVDLRDRPLETFLPEVIIKSQIIQAAKQNQDEEACGWFALPRGRHVVISACRPEEFANERRMDNDQVHGFLTYFLLDTLQQSSTTLTYRDVFARTSTLVRSRISTQNPLLAATENSHSTQQQCCPIRLMQGQFQAGY